MPEMKQKIVPADGAVTLTLKDRKLEAKVDVTQKPLQPLHAAASLPLDMQKVLQDPRVLMNAPLDATVTLPDSDLNVLKQFVPVISSVKGRVGLTAKVTGTAARPNITGNLRADATSIAFVQDDVPDARNVKLNVRFDGKRVYIEEAGALLAGGNITARGAIDWTDAANPKIDATLSAKEALILRDESISMRADGDIVCRGSLSQASVTGRVELVRGRVFKEIEFLPLSLPNQLPPAPPSVTVSKSSAPALPPPFDKWTLGIDIVTRDPVRLLGNVLNGGVVSNLRVTGTGAKPVLEGKAVLQDARVRLPFSRMTISRGDVIFSKDKPFEPQLDVQGDSFINNYQVTLNAYGPALNPKLRFTSSPPLSEGEIATLLATGSTSGDLRSSQGEAANRAAFLVLSQAYRKLFKKAGQTKLDAEPPRLSFSFSPLNSSGGSRSVSAVYEINKNLQAVGSFNQTGSFRGLLYYLIRFR
jgi:autotransporter translocation and assembly factor TamB